MPTGSALHSLPPLPPSVTATTVVASNNSGGGGPAAMSITSNGLSSPTTLSSHGPLILTSSSSPNSSLSSLGSASAQISPSRRSRPLISPGKSLLVGTMTNGNGLSPVGTSTAEDEVLDQISKEVNSS